MLLGVHKERVQNPVHVLKPRTLRAIHTCFENLSTNSKLSNLAFTELQ